MEVWPRLEIQLSLHFSITLAVILCTAKLAGFLTSKCVSSRLLSTLQQTSPCLFVCFVCYFLAILQDTILSNIVRLVKICQNTPKFPHLSKFGKIYQNVSLNFKLL